MIQRKMTEEEVNKLSIAVFQKQNNNYWYSNFTGRDGRDRNFRDRNRREWSSNRRGRVMTTKSGRIIKGRGKFVSRFSIKIICLLVT